MIFKVNHFKVKGGGGNQVQVAQEIQLLTYEYKSIKKKEDSWFQ